MAQHDGTIDDANGATVLADLNAAIAAARSNNSGTAAPPSPVAHMPWADTLNSVLWRRNAANSAWVLDGTLATQRVSVRTSNVVLALIDHSTEILASSTFTQTLTAAATLTAGWWVEYTNRGSGYITIDPSGSELINGLSTWLLLPGDHVKILCDGTGFIAASITKRKCLEDFMTAAERVDFRSRTLSLDLTAAVQAAFDSMTNKDVLEVGPGWAKITNLTVTNGGWTLDGCGYGSMFVTSHATQDIFLIGDGTTEITGLLFRNFRVWSTVTKTAGHVFNCRFLSNSRFENIYAGTLNDYVAASNSHRLYDGYYFDRFAECVVTGGQIVVANKPAKARGNADQSFGLELLLDGNLRIVYSGGPALHIGGACGGIYLGRVDISACRKGLLCDDTLQTGIYNREVFIDALASIDSCTGWGIEIADNGLAILDAGGVWVANCGSVGTGEGGILVAPTTGAAVSAKWGDARVQRCYYDGIQLNSGAHTFDGGYIQNNGQGTGGGNGITLGNAAVAKFTANGTIIHTNGNATRGYGWSNSGNAPNYSLQGVNFFGNGQGPINNPTGLSDPDNQIIRNNIGYVTSKIGFATIANGTSSIVVNHGLSEIPTNVLLSWAGSPDASQPYAAPGDFTATQFTIRTNANVTANRSVQWRAVRGNE